MGRQVHLPRLTCSMDIRQWRRRARRLGGNGFALLAALTVQLAMEYGRYRSTDGMVTLLLPINTRTSLDDDRAIAFDFAKLTIQPSDIQRDLSTLRQPLANLARLASGDDASAIKDLLPLVPYLSSSSVRAVADLLFDYDQDFPVTCSNLGELPCEVGRMAGSVASSMFIRGIDAMVYEHDLERTKGHLVVVASRINGRLSLSVEAYQLRATNSRSRLATAVVSILTTYGVDAMIEA